MLVSLTAKDLALDFAACPETWLRSNWYKELLRSGWRLLNLYVKISGLA